MTADPREHPMWLPPHALQFLRGRPVVIRGADPLLETIRSEAADAGAVDRGERVDAGTPASTLLIVPAADAEEVWPRPLPVAGLRAEGFVIAQDGDRTIIAYADGRGALYGWFQMIRDHAGGERRSTPARFEPQQALRVLDHWDNISAHPVMGQVERGYAGGSIFYADGSVRRDLGRVARYARLLASIGVNAVTINNVNVGRREAQLLTDDLGTVELLAGIFRPWGIRVHLSVNFASPLDLGDLDTSDPLDERVAQWWSAATAQAFARIPDLGGYLVKADSEGQPGPHAYGRDHADGANMLARALEPHGGVVRWRAFVYNHRQDWRDRSTDRARAAYDTFMPLDGRFDDNVLLQVKYGPIDFQTREPLSPVIAAMKHTRIALELQVTQEYTGQQRHAVYLAPQWSEILGGRPFGDGGPPVSELVRGGIAAVSNVGDDAYWTGHPLAQSNLYAYGRLAWDATLDARAVLSEWMALTFGDDEAVNDGIHSILDDSWATYESYTAPLGVGFMVTPGSHYGPSVDGYEYSPWGTYHFADRNGIGVDRTVATGTGYTGQYPQEWAAMFESLESVPDELLLFFHHVPYTHRLHNGATVIQHIYDTHFRGAEQAAELPARWDALRDHIDEDVWMRGAERFAEQARSAGEWRDQINTYFWRASGIPDEHGRTLY
ncbi:alpha-glucuronidase [Microbacterium sp. NEAU-LLC]|uniref:Alpha-glucuronidase n=1 Tax=Microbacterium helvum TaxID=2773713 RepID=A0ABR8NTX6_9MICO|nr:alpha-glucuronidase [Microbacterium helvum]MBD3943207.1 alpha-glucuronidase [Microbacterium helvum]